MSANPPPPSPSQGPGGPPKAGRAGALVALIGVVVVVGIVVAVQRSKGGGTPPAIVAPPVTTQSSGTVVGGRATMGYGQLEGAPSDQTPELFWLDVIEPRAVHATLRSNAWLGKALKDPIGQGFLAAWGGFFGSRGEDLGGAFGGAVSELVLDQVLASRYRVVWYGGEGAKGAPALVVPAPSKAANAAFDTLVKVAASGGFDPPSCVASSAGADGGAVAESVHRLVLADKILFAARLDDRLVFSPRPQAAMLAMCRALPTAEAKPGVAVSLGFSLTEPGRGAQSLAAVLGLGAVASLDFGVENADFVPRGLDATAEGGGRLAAVEPSAELLKAIPERSGVVLFLAVKLPRTLSAQALRDTLAPAGENFGGTRKEWPLGEPRQVAVIWNPRGVSTTEIAVLWAQADDERALAEAMTKGKGALQAGKACSVLAYASTKDLLSELQATCAGKKPSVVQASQPVAKGLAQPSSVALTVNLGRVLSQLTLDGWFSEHPSPNARTGPQEIEAARKLLEELPTLGFRATLGADGKLVSGGFKS